MPVEKACGPNISTSLRVRPASASSPAGLDPILWRFRMRCATLTISGLEPTSCRRREVPLAYCTRDVMGARDQCGRRQRAKYYPV